MRSGRQSPAMMVARASNGAASTTQVHRMQANRELLLRGLPSWVMSRNRQLE
jgi:hypothetical protein